MKEKEAFLSLIYISVSTANFSGFSLPLGQLIYWAVITASSVFDIEFLLISIQSFKIAFVSAVSTVIFALILIYFSKWSVLRTIKSISRVGVLRYAIPGAVIAIGI